jgi:hypothetical protein
MVSTLTFPSPQGFGYPAHLKYKIYKHKPKVNNVTLHLKINKWCKGKNHKTWTDVKMLTRANVPLFPVDEYRKHCHKWKHTVLFFHCYGQNSANGRKPCFVLGMEQYVAWVLNLVLASTTVLF